MDRVELIEKLFDIKREVSARHIDYLSKQRDYLEGDELYMREAHLVLEVGVNQAPKMSELAERLNVTQGAISQMVGRLEEKGYLYRKQSEEDRRSNLVYLTDKGKKLRDNHIEYDKKRHKEIADKLNKYTSEELEMFIDYEKEMLKTLNWGFEKL